MVTKLIASYAEPNQRMVLVYLLTYSTSRLGSLRGATTILDDHRLLATHFRPHHD